MGGRSRGQGEGNKKRGQGEGNKKRRRGEGDRKRKHGDLQGDLAAVEELKKVIREQIQVDDEFATPEKLLEVEKALDANAEGRVTAEEIIRIFGEKNVKKIGGLSVARLNDENRERVLTMVRDGEGGCVKDIKTGGFEVALEEFIPDENEKHVHGCVKCDRCKKKEVVNGVEINKTERRCETEKKRTEAAAVSSDDEKNNELGRRTGAKKKKTKKNKKKKTVEHAPEHKDDSLDRGEYDCFVDKEGRGKEGFLCSGCSQKGVVFRAKTQKDLRSHVEQNHKDFLARESTKQRAMKCNLCTLEKVEYYARCEKEIQRHADTVHPGAIPLYIKLGKPLFSILTNVPADKMRRINKMSGFAADEKPMYRPPLSCVRCQIFFPEGQEKAFKHVEIHHPEARNRGICMGIPKDYANEDLEESEKTRSLLEYAGIDPNVLAKTVVMTQKTLPKSTEVSPEQVKDAIKKAFSVVMAEEGIDVTKYDAAEEATKNKKDEYSYLCWNCSKNKSEVDQLFKCGGCKVARYCSESCKNNDWKEHGDWCLKKQQKRLARKAKKAAKTESELD